MKSWRYDCEKCGAFLLGICQETAPPKKKKCHKCGKYAMVVSEIWQARRRRGDPAFDRPKRVHGLKDAYARNLSEVHAIMEKNELKTHPADESGIVSPLGWAKETSDDSPLIPGLNSLDRRNPKE